MQSFFSVRIVNSLGKYHLPKPVRASGKLNNVEETEAGAYAVKSAYAQPFFPARTQTPSPFFAANRRPE